MIKKIINKEINEPEEIGSYNKNDVIFLLKDISNDILEKKTEEREKLIQTGKHYSEMLPVEYIPSEEYLKFFYESLNYYSDKIALATGIVSEDIFEKNKNELVLVSLARAGTPFGILIKRYLKYKFKINIPHYSLSIIRGKGIDENAIIYIIKKHGTNIQFIDGWTGKGTITKALDKACDDFYKKYNIKLNSDLAVLADPGYCSSMYGTREDFLIPSACLNATVSGLISRTVHRKDLIKENDFHGVKYYKELAKLDLSNFFIDKISSRFEFLVNEISFKIKIEKDRSKLWLGLKDVEKIKNYFLINDSNLIKPGIGETTRVLLRRVPWKILINNKNLSNIEHISILAKEKNVELVNYPLNSYQCCGIIKPNLGNILNDI